MNNLEEHVVSIDMAEKMKRIGWAKPTRFYFLDGNLMDNHHEYELSDQVIYSPLSTELLNELPWAINSEHGICYLRITKEKGSNNDRYTVQYTCSIYDNRNMVLYDVYTTACKTSQYLANTLARVWVYLNNHDLLPKEERE